jgi:hypothetical protein
VGDAEPSVGPSSETTQLSAVQALAVYEAALAADERRTTDNGGRVQWHSCSQATWTAYRSYLEAWKRENPAEPLPSPPTVLEMRKAAAEARTKAEEHRLARIEAELVQNMEADPESFRVEELLRASCLTARARNHADVAAYLFGLGQEAEAEEFLAAVHDESRRAESQLFMERGTELYEREID